jgi:plasmid stabilization system protein ParE
MEYKIIVSPKAQLDIEKAIDYYAEKSEKAPKKFIEHLAYSYKAISINPYFFLYYKNIRGLKIKKFPYSLFFIINEKQKTVKILSCFHNKKHPAKRIK